MDISFRSSQDVQIIEISGVIGETEAAAIRFKLDQKINQGRHKVLFDLLHFDVKSNASRALLLGVIDYCRSRETLTILSGIPPEHWPLFLMSGSPQPKILGTVAEALDYASKNSAPLDSKSEDLKVAAKKDDEIKEEALKKLLQKYEVFQGLNDFDPFRLAFLSRQYRTSPSREILAVEREASDHAISTQEEVARLERECEDLGTTLKTLAMLRKSPLTSKELQIKQESLNKEIQEISAETAKLDAKVTELRNSLRDERNSFKEDVAELEASLKTLHENFQNISTSSQVEIENLRVQDAQEQADFDIKIKSLSVGD